jgi:hypothetical protein
MVKMSKLKILLLSSIFFFLFSTPVFAAELFLQSANQKFSIGDEFLVNVFLSTSGESINTVQAKIIFSEAFLQLKEIRIGNSVINFWINQPKATPLGVIDFSGVITNGYKGTNGFLFSAVFSAKSAGKGEINFDSIANVLLNDGNGTQASLKISPLQFLISKQTSAAGTTIEPLKDTEPPQDFTPLISQNSEIFGGKYFLVFSTQDLGSGIDHYEVYEAKNETKNLINVKWITAESPYVLQDQSLQSFIYVKAVDKSGNEKIEKMRPAAPALKWYENWWFWFIIILGVLSAIIIGYLIRAILWKKFKNK